MIATKLFWSLVVVDACVIVVLIYLDLTTHGAADGGREMSMVFGAVLPAIVIGVGAAIYATSTSTTARVIAWVLVAAPGAFVLIARGNSALIDARVRDNASGAGYFSGADFKAAGKAIVARDIAALDEHGRRIDVNARGPAGITLLELAVEQAYDAPAVPGSSTTSLEIVRKLLVLGAHPNDGLEGATKLADDGVLRALLDAGATPNYANERGPVVFNWLNMMPAANFAILVERGLDVNLMDGNGAPLIVAAAQQDRWNLVLLLLQRGADGTRADKNGTRLVDVVQSRAASTTERPADMKADIARVSSLLK